MAQKKVTTSHIIHTEMLAAWNVSKRVAGKTYQKRFTFCILSNEEEHVIQSYNYDSPNSLLAYESTIDKFYVRIMRVDIIYRFL